MILYIKKSSEWVNFMNSDELRDFANNYTGQKLCIGDVSLFNKSALQLLLKLVEENPQINLFSSSEVTLAPLLSRALKVVKHYVPVKPGYDFKQFFESNQSFIDCQQFLAELPNEVKLLVPSTNLRLTRLLTAQLSVY